MPLSCDSVDASEVQRAHAGGHCGRNAKSLGRLLASGLRLSLLQSTPGRVSIFQLS